MGDSRRIEWVDLMKGIAIIWLIVYHLYVFGWMRSPVPVFFFLSGLFFSEGKSFGSFVGKKARALLVPFAFFFVLGLAASVLKHLLQGEAYSLPPLWLFATLFPADAPDVNPLGVGAIWFLISLFEVYIIYYVLRLVSKNRWWLLTAGVLLVLVSAVMMQYYAMGSLFYLPYTFGYCLFFIVAHQYRDRILCGEMPVWVLLIAAAAYSVRFIDLSKLLNESKVWGGICQTILWLVSMSGLITLLLWLCKKISVTNPFSGSKAWRFLLFEGQNSLTILGTHLLVMSVNAVILGRFLPENVLYYVLQVLIIIVACNICILLFNRFVPFLVNHKSGKTQ